MEVNYIFVYEHFELTRCLYRTWLFIFYGFTDGTWWVGSPFTTVGAMDQQRIGPCSIDMDGFSPNGTLWNPYSWNAEANIFFLDQPYAVLHPA